MERIINSEEEFNKIIEKGITLVDFYAVWCGPCKLLAPFIEKVAEKYEGKVNVCKVDVDKLDSVCYKYGIRSIPTLIYFEDGKVKNVEVGFQDISMIEKNLDSLLNK